MENLNFKSYKRKGLTELIRYEDFPADLLHLVSVSAEDEKLNVEEFRKGYIARNPENHNDLWYVAKKYFDNNLEPVLGKQRQPIYLTPTIDQLVEGLKCDMHNMSNTYTSISKIEGEYWDIKDFILTNNIIINLLKSAIKYNGGVNAYLKSTIRISNG